MRHKGLLGWCYDSRCNYMITLVTEPRANVFGILREWGVERTEEGRALYESWEAIEAKFPGVRATYNAIMPDHFHGIIFIQQPMDIPLGQVVWGFMAGTTKAYHTMIESAITPTVRLHLETVLRSAYLPTSQPLWEKGFHDRPLTRKGQLQTMIAYLHDNPRRLFVRRHSARTFELRQGVQVGAQVFDAMGNHALLQRPLHAVHVRRRFSEQERRAYMNACIIAARQGRALVGAFISEYEQQVRAVALREGHAVIQLTTDLLTDYYKPSGELFDVCGRGQVLLLSQRTTLDSFSRRITRAECNTLNTLAEEIAGV